MKRHQFFKLTIGLGTLFIMTGACKKNAPETDPVTDSIYGTYVKSLPGTGQWTDIFNGIIIKVKPYNPQYITITISGGLSAAERIFDSVKLVTGRTFTVNTVSRIP